MVNILRTFTANSMEIGLAVGIEVGGVVISAQGIIHRPVQVHLRPKRIVLPQYTVVQPVLEKVMVHSVLHTVTMDKSKCKARPGIM